MKVMFKKDHFDKECEKKFEVAPLGHVACCAEMNNALRRIFVAPNELWGGDRAKHYATPRVFKDHLSSSATVHAQVDLNNSHAPVKFCPYCGTEVVAEEVKAAA